MRPKRPKFPRDPLLAPPYVPTRRLFARSARFLHGGEADALIVSGSETDVCVLATMLDAVDIGFRVIVVRDAVCSSSDEGHEMLMRLYHTRYTEQIETADAEAILSRWE